MRRRAAVLTAALALAGCSGGPVPSSAPSTAPSTTPTSAPSTATTGAGGLPVPEHVVVVVFENKDAEQVIGSPDAPYLTSLAGGGAAFTDAHAETHPSQPNYLALFSGSTHGVTDDSCPLRLTGDSLASQLLASGRTFTGFSEDLPAAGSTVCTAGGYARKHNPWVDFPALPAEVNQPLHALPADFADLPTVSFVVPNLCDDMHDCDVATGDAWAREHLAPYVDWAGRHDSLLVVTFDESEGGDSENHIPTFLVGPMVAAGPTGQRIDHYSLLRTIEAMYALDPLGEAANRDPVSGIWKPVD